MFRLKLVLLSVFLLLASASKMINVEQAAEEDLARAKKLYQIHEQGSAQTAVKVLIEKYPDTQAGKEAKELLTEMGSKDKAPVITPPPAVAVVDATAIGLLLPLSGPAATYGLRTLAAVQMALGLPYAKSGNSDSIWIQKSEGITLIIANTKGDAKLAASLTETLVNTHHVVGIMGDILTDSAAAVAKKCQSLGITNLSLSRQNDITHTGDWIFRLGMTTPKQTRTIAEQISGISTLKKVAIVFPDNSYGKDMKASLTAELQKHDIKVSKAISYKADETTFTGTVDKLGTAPFNFDVMFLPDFPKTVSYIVPALVAHGFNRKRLGEGATIQLTGPSSWSGPLLAQRLGKQIDGGIFVDGIDWGTPGAESFKTAFIARMQGDPTLIEAQAYDAASIAKSIIASAKTREAFRDNLKNLTAWKGITGLIAFDDKRDSNAPLSCFEFQNGQTLLRVTRP